MAKKFGFDHPTPHNTLLFSGIDTQLRYFSLQKKKHSRHDEALEDPWL